MATSDQYYKEQAEHWLGIARKFARDSNQVEADSARIVAGHYADKWLSHTIEGRKKQGSLTESMVMWHDTALKVEISEDAQQIFNQTSACIYALKAFLEEYPEPVE
jgi:hypothetical protein